MNLGHRILQTLDAQRQHTIFALLDDEYRPTTHLTGGDLAGEAREWLDKFASLGLGPHSTIALALDRDQTLCTAHVGALALGAAVVPVNTNLSTTEFDALMDAATPDLVGIHESVSEKFRLTLDRLGSRVLELPIDTENKTASPCTPLSSQKPSSYAETLLLFTSGTTGAPKSVPLSHTNLVANLEALSKVWQRATNDRLLHILPAHHFHGLVLGIYGSLLVGNEIWLAPRFDASRCLEAITREEITLLMAVPTMYARMADQARAERIGPILRHLRLAISGSAPLGERLWADVEQTLGTRIVERYGLTETGIISSNPIDRPKPASVGKPLPKTEVIIDRSEAAAPDTTIAPNYANPFVNKTGEILVRGPAVMRGYGHGSADADAFQDGFFKTGDLGYFDDDGYLWITGRAKELIIVGGSNVTPGEVERALESVDGITEIAAVGVPDEDLGETVVAVIVSKPAFEKTALANALRHQAEQALAPYKRPRRYVFVDELPRNGMGKIDRTGLTRLAERPDDSA